MTFSQSLKERLVLPFKKSIILLLVGIGLIFGVSTEASAEGTKWFHTQDGKDDNFVWTTSLEPNVQIDVWGLKDGNGNTYSPKSLRVRLCRLSYFDGNVCTGFKYFSQIKPGYGRVTFTQMFPAGWSVDIRDTSLGTYVTGYNFVLGY